MPINFNEQALSQFRNLSLDNQNAIVTQGQDNQLQSTETLGNSPLRWIRSDATQQANNAVRTELLKSLGEAFGIKQGIGQDGQGRATFSKDFMDKLKSMLGADLKAVDFGVDRSTGLVSSGKPLTKRRIDAILAKATKIASEADTLARLAGTLAGLSIRENRSAFQEKFDLVQKDLDKPSTLKAAKGVGLESEDKDLVMLGICKAQQCINFFDGGGAKNLLRINENAAGHGSRFRILDADRSQIKSLKGPGDLSEKFRMQTGHTIKLSDDLARLAFSPAQPGEGPRDDQAILRAMQEEIDQKVEQYTVALLDTYMQSKQAGKLGSFFSVLASAGDSIEGRLEKIKAFSADEL
ncbi:MAG: hypothetical protein K6A65_05710 [Succinivibrionaceae bacterium]|nr:hypothetical protein [Succinivibrionaceae bacterium]